MIKSLKRLFVKIARSIIRFILWVIKSNRKRKEKRYIKRESIPNIKSFQNSEKKELRFINDFHRKNYEGAMKQIAKWQANPPTIEEALKRQRQRDDGRDTRPPNINHKHLNEAHRKSEEAKWKYLSSLNSSEIDWTQEIERQKINAKDDPHQEIHESFKKRKSEISSMCMSEHGEWFNKEAARLEKEQYPTKDIEATQTHSFDYTKLTKKELDILYHQIIDKALENYKYRLHVLFTWKINHEEFHYRAASSIALRIRQEEKRLKKHQIIDEYFKTRWADMSQEEIEADRKFILDQGRLRTPN